MPRPRKPIDKGQVIKLARLGCTQDEIAEFFDVDRSTISRRFAREVSRARAACKIALRRAQMHRAIKGKSDAMLIHLGKVYLGQNGGTSQDDLRAILSGLVAPHPSPTEP
jgi:hypothetical protein